MNFLPGLALAHSGLVVWENPDVPSACNTGSGNCPWTASPCHSSSKVSKRRARIFRIPRGIGPDLG